MSMNLSSIIPPISKKGLTLSISLENPHHDHGAMLLELVDLDTPCIIVWSIVWSNDNALSRDFIQKGKYAHFF